MKSSIGNIQKVSAWKLINNENHYKNSSKSLIQCRCNIVYVPSSLQMASCKARIDYVMLKKAFPSGYFPWECYLCNAITNEIGCNFILPWINMAMCKLKTCCTWWTEKGVPRNSCYQCQGANPSIDRTYPIFPTIILLSTSLSECCFRHHWAHIF
jgi:hypothetical protein